MALRACPRCQATYVASVTTCADCRVALVEVDDTGAPVAGSGADPVGGIDPGADGVVGYDLTDWTAEQQAELSESLGAARIPYTWDGDEVVVHEDRADVVEELIDEIDHPDALDADADDGDDTGAQLLSDLYVASDVLVGDPDNRAAVTELLEAGESIAATPPPFGVDRSVWTALAERVDTLAGLLGEDAEEDEVIPAAKAVRDTLRPLV